MSISSIPPVAAQSITPITNKAPATQPQQAKNPAAAPAAARAVADNDGDHDGSGAGINVKA